MRTIRAPYETVLDSIAVDVVAKTLIVAAWKKAMDDEIVNDERDNKVVKISDEMTVYNCATLHSMTLGKIVYCGQFLVRTWPFEKTLWLPGGGVTLCPYMNYLRVSVLIELFTRMKTLQILN
jgi:alcohol-forming fatty acyl-CoA reductase